MGKRKQKFLNKGQKLARKIEQEDEADFLKTRKLGPSRRVDRDYWDMREAQESGAFEQVEAQPEEQADAKPTDTTPPDAKAEGAKGEGEAAAEAPESKPDPYLMADATYIQKDLTWRNKQRTLVFCSRGVNSTHRHFAEDIKKLLPHHKPEPKFEKKSTMHEINEICELKSCNNVIYFESRKRKDLYMWLGRVPLGPTMKFQVLNIHTTGEVKLAGNCLLGSRPIMYFDKNFEELSFLKLMRELIMQAFGTPRNHPKSKPFHDHAMCFYWLDRKIWFRHYQVAPEGGLDDFNDPERQTLTEIGPRFVLEPIRILSGSFSGQAIYVNPHYMTPTALRSFANKMKAIPYLERLRQREEAQKKAEELALPDDPLDEIFE